MNPIEFPMIFSTSSKVLRFFHTDLFPETSNQPGVQPIGTWGSHPCRGLKLLGRNLDNPDQRIAQVPGPFGWGAVGFFQLVGWIMVGSIWPAG